MKSTAETVDQYLAELSPDRREAISAICDVVRAHLPKGFEEGMQFGMISWYIPLERYPDTYNRQALGVVALASQKNHMALYLMAVYGDDGEREWFEDRWRGSGKRLDMGKSCVRFKRLDDVPLDVVGEAVSRTSPEQFIRRYEASRAGR